MMKLLLFSGALLLGVMLIAIREEVMWGRYADEHHCIKIHEIPATNGWVNGQSLYIAGHKTYRCDGGEEITR